MEKKIFLKKMLTYLSVSAIMFRKQFSAYTVHNDWCYDAIHKRSIAFIIYLC